jgi:hypothetical protein
MEGITLFVAGVAVLLVLFLRPRYGLIVYLVTLLCYPSYLRIIVFGCTISAGRFVAMALLIRCILNEQLRKGFRWTKLDTLVIIADAIYMLTLCYTLGDAFIDGIKLQSGTMVDTTFAYFSARLIINNRDVLVNVIKIVSIVLVIMAFLGAIEAATKISPYTGLLKYGVNTVDSAIAYKFEARLDQGQDVRYGFFRAQGPRDHPIIFGATFALLLPLVWKLLWHARWQHLRIPICGAIVVGGASSVSSTPFTGILAALAGLMLERFERWAKHFVVLLVLLAVFVEFYSERNHFYYVFLAKMSFLGGDAFYRGNLIDTALKHLPEYWLTGYGIRDPGWGLEVSDVEHTDLAVHFVFLMVMYGIFGLLAYLAIVFNLLFSLWHKYRKALETFDRNICWALIVCVLVILVIDLGVTPFGVLPSLYSIIFGIGGSIISPTFQSQNGIRDTSTLLAVSSTKIGRQVTAI